jgi:alkylation response protein AidB-like acyl-CoA dehydrogenase
VTSTQTAFEVASEAVQIFGGNGLSREYPVEKLLRDARASLIEDGVNEVLGLHAAEKLAAA